MPVWGIKNTHSTNNGLAQILNSAPLLILGNPEPNHFPHSHFPFLSKQALGYLQQCYWYTLSELNHFSDHCSSFNTQRSQNSTTFQRSDSSPGRAPLACWRNLDLRSKLQDPEVTFLISQIQE